MKSLLPGVLAARAGRDSTTMALLLVLWTLGVCAAGEPWSLRPLPDRTASVEARGGAAARREDARRCRVPLRPTAFVTRVAVSERHARPLLCGLLPAPRAPDGLVRG